MERTHAVRRRRVSPTSRYGVATPFGTFVALDARATCPAGTSRRSGGTTASVAGAGCRTTSYHACVTVAPGVVDCTSWHVQPRRRDHVPAQWRPAGTTPAAVGCTCRSREGTRLAGRARVAGGELVDVVGARQRRPGGGRVRDAARRGSRLRSTRPTRRSSTRTRCSPFQGPAGEWLLGHAIGCPRTSSTSAPDRCGSVSVRGGRRRQHVRGDVRRPRRHPVQHPLERPAPDGDRPEPAQPDRREEEREPHLDGRVVDDALPEDRDDDDVHGVRGQRERPDGRERREDPRPPVGDHEARRRSRAARRRRCRRPRTWSTSAARRSPAPRASRAGAARPRSRRARGPRARRRPGHRCRAAAVERRSLRPIASPTSRYAVQTIAG